MPSFVQNLLRLPTRSKAILAVSAAAILVIAVLGLKAISAPSYTLISSGLNPAQTGKITTALDSAGITYELRNNGTALAVDKAQAAQAQVALASQGVSLSSTGANAGYSLLDKQSLGSSQFQQQVTYQRALEGELANTLDTVQGVTGAQVSLVLPSQDLFTDNSSPATAAVMMTNTADTLGPGAVRGMAQLVSSSVKGLKIGNVSITDGSGQLVWPQGDGTVGGGSNKQALEGRYANQVESDLNALLTRTLGPGKAQVQVTADLNADKVTKQSKTYAKKGVALHQTTDVEKLKGGSATTGGAAGTGSNLPTYSAAGAGANGNSNYGHTTKSTDFGVDETIAKTEVAPGAVNKLNVALLVDTSVPAATFSSISATVKQAAGVTPARGDGFQAAQVAFAKPAIPKTGPVPTTLLGPLKWVGMGIASLVFLFFMTRSLRKREGESLAQPSWLTQIEEPVSLAELEQRTAQPMHLPEQPTIVLPPRVPDQSMHTLDQLMEREPERVAAQVRQWMAED
jgi:flagellar M-ring protein FliF